MLFVVIAGFTSVLAANYDFEEGGYYYIITSSEARTVGISPKSSYDDRDLYSGHVIIPETVTHDGVTYTVTSIEESTFNACSNLFQVDIPETVTKIGINAFRTDYNLTSIKLPSNLEVIGNMAFEGSGISSIVIPDKVKVIGQMTFSKCFGLSRVTLGKSVNEIQQNAFYDSPNLGEITCLATIPPALNDRGFTNWNATVYVPDASLQAYLNADVWNKFPNIKPIGGDMTAPIASIQVSKSYVNVGATVTLKAVASNTIDSVHWTLPESVTLTKGSLDSTEIEVSANALGQQVFKVELSNKYGSTVINKDLFDVVDAISLDNVALNKMIDSFSGSTANGTKETPDYLVDGDTYPDDISHKWCNDATNHWVIIDLQDIYKLYQFKIYDCNSGPEKYDNIDKYRIYTSTDKENWDLVVDAKNRANDDIKSDYIPPVKARYIRFNPYNENSFTIRVWEFEAYGELSSNHLTLSAPADTTINTGDTEYIPVVYNLNGDERAADISATATDASGRLTVGTISDDAAKHQFLIPVTAANNIGYADLNVTVNNGGATSKATVHFTVDTRNAENVLSGEQAEIRQYSSDDLNDYTTTTTDGLTDGNKTADALNDSRATHKDNDLWAVFTAPTLWSLAKVNVFLPNAETNTNDVTLKVSLDGKNWNDIKKFENIGTATELSYILPNYREIKYLAVVANTTNGSKPQLSEVEAYEQFQEGLSEQAPLVIASGWNQDVIVEAKPAADHSSIALDDQGWDYFTSDVRQEGSLPADGYIVTKKGNKYQLADFAQNNAVVLKSTDDEATLTLAAPVYAKSISILASSANGQSQISVKANYNDGSDDQGVFTIDDWYSDKENQGEAVYGLSRIIRNDAADWKPDDFDYRSQFRLFEDELQTDPTKQIVSITFNSTKGGSYPAVLAVSRVKADNVPATGIDALPASSEAGLLVNGHTLTVDAANVKSVRVFSVDGALVAEKAPQNNQAVIALPAGSGLYIAQIVTENGTQTRKFIVK